MRERERERGVERKGKKKKEKEKRKKEKGKERKKPYISLKESANSSQKKYPSIQISSQVCFVRTVLLGHTKTIPLTRTSIFEQ